MTAYTSGFHRECGHHSKGCTCWYCRHGFCSGSHKCDSECLGSYPCGGVGIKVPKIRDIWASHSLLVAHLVCPKVNGQYQYLCVLRKCPRCPWRHLHDGSFVFPPFVSRPIESSEVLEMETRDCVKLVSPRSDKNRAELGDGYLASTNGFLLNRTKTTFSCGVLMLVGLQATISG